MKPIHLLAAAGAFWALVSTTHAATYVKGHNLSASELLAANGGAGEFMIVNEAQTGGNDMTADAGNPIWGWSVNSSEWTLGDKVGLTGIAIPFWASDPDSDGTNNTQNATHRIRFYSAGPDNEWQGNDNIGTSDDSFIGSVDVTFASADAGVAVYHVNFDAPLVWASADSSTVYFYIQALDNKAMRIKSGTAGATAKIEQRNTGADMTVNGSTTTRLSLAGKIIRKVWFGDDDNADTLNTADWDTTSLFWDAGTAAYADGDAVLFGEGFDGSSSVVNLTTALAPSSVTVDHASTGTVPTYTFSGSGKLGGAMTLTRSGDGTLVLANTGGNDFTGETRIVQGIVMAGADSVLSPASVVVLGGTGSSILDLNGTSQTIAGLTTTSNNTRQVRNGSATDATLTIDNTADFTYGSQLGGTTEDLRNFNLVKTGTGTQAITNAFTNYTGTTLVSAGILDLTGNLTHSSAVTVEGTGTLKVGGAVTNGVTVGTGGTFAAGNAGSGDGSVGALALGSGATLAVGIDSASATAELTVVTGSVSIDPAATLTVTDLAGSPVVLPGATVLTLIDYSTGTLSGTFNGLAEGAIVSVGGNAFVLSYGSGTADVVTLTAGAADPYGDWAAANITDINPGAPAGFNDDADDDDLDNGLEWILGGNPLSGDLAGVLPVATGSAATGLTIVFNRAPDSIDAVSLAVEWDTDLDAGFAQSIPIGTTNVGPDGDNPAVALDSPAAGQVTVTIPAANAGSAGRIFARLVASPN